jgi:LPXTG-motif cell wall-anchored protein
METSAVRFTGMSGDVVLTTAGILVFVLTIGFIIVLRKTKASERQRELEAQQKAASPDEEKS